MTKNLNGLWKVSHVPYGADISPMLDENFVPEGFLSANVPEEIHATLRRAGAIRGQTYAKTDAEEQWVEESDWVYLKGFHLPREAEGKTWQLTFCGLDTFCDIYLNGQKIGRHQNMHRPCTLQVTEQLRYGAYNRLAVRFYSPVKYVAGRDEHNIFSITTSERIFARKAQMNYSWDFCGRCVTVGIWKDVVLEEVPAAALEDYAIRTCGLVGESAVLNLACEVRTPDEGDWHVEATLTLGDEVHTLRLPVRDGRPQGDWIIPQPQLWWPRPYGDQPLYDLEVALCRGDEKVSLRRQRLGIRTLEVLQEKQEDGFSFQFCVNGRKLFIRGANWVPLNMIYTDITARDYEEVLHAAAKGRISMLRVWGGGIYEPDTFYDLCDRYGILVWSDFMLSCGIYPHDEDFLKEMALEAEHVLRRTRNYTCVALWSGDNEVGQSYIWAGREYEYELDPINHQVLKEACERLDPHRFYLPTSPGSPLKNERGGDNQESPYQGDLHLYIMRADRGVTSHRDYGKEYYKRVLGYRPRFVSEFGFVSLPEKDTYYQFNARREALRNPAEIIKFLPFTEELLRQGRTDEVIYYSQVFNSLALKYWIEYFRSLKGTCSGTLYWKFNDPLAASPDDWMYPCQMCSIDMYHRTKMTYYYTRRAYADVLVSFVEDLAGRVKIVGCNETLEDVPGKLCVMRRRFDGAVMAKYETEGVILADAATELAVLPQEVAAAEHPMEEYMTVTFTAGDEVYSNRYYFAELYEINQLKLPEGKVEAAARVEGDRVVVTVKALSFIRSLRLNILDQRADYSDNYFDMEEGETRQITIDLLEGEGAMDQALYLEGENLACKVLPLCEMA